MCQSENTLNSHLTQKPVQVVVPQDITDIFNSFETESQLQLNNYITLIPQINLLTCVSFFYGYLLNGEVFIIKSFHQALDIRYPRRYAREKNKPASFLPL